MEAFDAILTRRSIRKYKPVKVSDENVKKLLECGFAAPTARNKRPLHFLVIEDRGQLIALGAMHVFTAMVAQSALSILVCGDLGLEDRRQFLDQDGSAATQNILLGAHAMGLGAVWCGVPKDGEREIAIRGICGLPENIVPVSLVAIGVPDEKKDAPDRYDGTRVRQTAGNGITLA